MRFAKNISLLFAISALSACQTVQIPNIRICKEIPFIDAPEGACVHTLSHTEEIIPAQQWAAERPYQLVLDPDSWSEIKKSWLSACLKAKQKCNVEIESIDSIIKTLDELAGKILQP